MFENILTPELRKLAPAGEKPATLEEWANTQKLHLEMGYRSLRAMGMGRAEAKVLAKRIYGGEAGRLLLEMAFGSEDATGGQNR